MKNKILIIAAHPDDEILGCGGVIARLIKEGHSVYTLILGEGITSRDESRNVSRRKKEIENLKGQARRANKILGVKEVFFYDFPDNRFDTVPLLDIVKVIEKIKKQIAPDIVFTHTEKDLNIDHQITYKAVITATRPLAGETIKEIYSFEIPSSTNWKFPISFSPDVFSNISATLPLKIRALRSYKSELKRYPHPRSIKGIIISAEYYGMRIGFKYAEAFECQRIIK
ncbi:MAG: PIG-L family deacetylase [Candidatus Omnitrophota bacterium]|jgi:LmbE family N-acetylglucosaminyl deacetylase